MHTSAGPFHIMPLSPNGFLAVMTFRPRDRFLNDEIPALSAHTYYFTTLIAPDTLFDIYFAGATYDADNLSHIDTLDGTIT